MRGFFEGRIMEPVYVSVGGEEIKLPALTIQLSEQMEAASKAGTMRERAKARYEWLQQLIPAKKLASRLGGSSFDEVDCVALEMLFTQAANAYRTPVIEEQARIANEQVKALKPVLDVMSRRGFKAVK